MDTYSKELLSRTDDGVIHRAFCGVCRTGAKCLEEAIRSSGRNDLNDDDVPAFVRSRYAEKHNLRFESYRWPTGGTHIEWRRMSTV